MPLPVLIISHVYESNGNHLALASDVVITDYGNGDFKDVNTVSTDYSYLPSICLPICA